jgi:hypothetical protein
MATRRDDLQRSLAGQDPDALRLILDAAGVSPREAVTASDLAARVVDGIWWNYSTPLGYVAERASFEDVVSHLAFKLGVAHAVDPDQPVWDQVAALTHALFAEIPAGGITFDDVDAHTRAKLGGNWSLPVGLGLGAGTSFGSWYGSSKVLNLLRTPIGRLLPLLPVVGPWVGAVRTGLTAVQLVSGPLGIGLAVASLNTSLGTNYARLVPLVLGVGALRPAPVEEAQEIPFPGLHEVPAPEHPGHES